MKLIFSKLFSFPRERNPKDKVQLTEKAKVQSIVNKPQDTTEARCLICCEKIESCENKNNKMKYKKVFRFLFLKKNFLEEN